MSVSTIEPPPPTMHLYLVLEKDKHAAIVWAADPAQAARWVWYPGPLDVFPLEEMLQTIRVPVRVGYLDLFPEVLVKTLRVLKGQRPGSKA